MIFIVVKFTVRPEFSDSWIERTAAFTAATRAEPGNVFFEWSRSVDDPNQFVLVEGFAGQEAGEAHVGSDHFKAAMETMGELIAAVPQIVNTEIAQDGWSAMSELSPEEA
ncbi:putative quinol monooxygenase [Streptomyces sp. NPDC050658]|uniref:putative quinol monooxygenase n=1 Tax=unclassified Streptomyces TaxID=2593676 RepID=UPI00343D5D2D